MSKKEKRGNRGTMEKSGWDGIGNGEMGPGRQTDYAPLLARQCGGGQVTNTMAEGDF
jgi:hypothetical protein